MRFPELVLLAGLSMSVSYAEESVRFAKYEGHKEMAYAFDVLAPWANGGKLTINFPEHLQFKTTGKVAILAEYEKNVKGWQIAADGLSAVLEEASQFQPGVKVKATAKVVQGTRVEFTLVVTNESKSTFPDLVPLLCHHYGQLAGFPKGVPDSFKHTYAMQGGKLTALADMPFEKADAEVRGAYIAGCSQRPQNVKDFPARFGGFIEKDLDAALVALTALDGKHKVLLTWTPGMSLLSNASIPCLHADPFLGTLEPGKTVEAKGVLVFTDAALEEAVAALQKEGAGAPPKKPEAPAK